MNQIFRLSDYQIIKITEKHVIFDVKCTLDRNIIDARL